MNREKLQEGLALAGMQGRVWISEGRCRLKQGVSIQKNVNNYASLLPWTH